MSRHEQKIKDGAARFLEDGEQVLAAVIAAPRGSTQQAAGSMQFGSPQRARAHTRRPSTRSCASGPRWPWRSLHGGF